VDSVERVNRCVEARQGIAASQAFFAFEIKN